MVILALNKIIEVTSTILLTGGLLWFGYQVMGRSDKSLHDKKIGYLILIYNANLRFILTEVRVGHRFSDEF